MEDYSRDYKKPAGFVQCKFCGTRNLIWMNQEGAWRLFDETGGQHQCRGSQRSGSGAMAQLPDAVKAMAENPSNLEAILKGVSDLVDGKLQEHTDTLVSTVQGGMSMLAQSKDKIIKEAIDQAIIAAEARLPVRHYTEVKVVDHVTKLDGHPHRYLGTLIQVVAQGLHVFMIGPAGSGKTTAAYQCSKALSLPYYESSMGPATSQWDLVGFRSPDGKYVPGIMREPYEKGGILMLDEMDNTNPSVLTTLNSALAGEQCTFPDGSVKRHKDFRCIAAGNTYGLGADRLYVGRNQLDAATLDRFANLNWDYDEEAEKDWAGLDQLLWIEYVQQVRHICQSHAMRVVVSPRASINGAILLRAGMKLELVQEIVLWKGMSQDDKKRVQAEVRPPNLSAKSMGTSGRM